MKRKKQRRSGATETFSVSVAPQTKRALRALADRLLVLSRGRFVAELSPDVGDDVVGRAMLGTISTTAPTIREGHA